MQDMKDCLKREIKRLCLSVDVLHKDGLYKRASEVLAHASYLSSLVKTLENGGNMSAEAIVVEAAR